MTEQEKIRAIAELDGFRVERIASSDGFPYFLISPNGYKSVGWRSESSAWSHGVPPYLTSRDSIVPVIERQPGWIRQEFFYELMKVRGMENMPSGTASVQISITHLQFSDMIISSASQLCEALLRATGKWKP